MMAVRRPKHVSGETNKPFSQDISEKCRHYFENTQLNEQVTVQNEEDKLSLPRKLSKNDLDTKFPEVKLHPSVVDLYNKYPSDLKLPKKCLENNMEPIVSLSIDEVDHYLKKRNLDMTRLISNSGCSQPKNNKVIKKKRNKIKTVAPLKIKKKVLTNHEKPDDVIVKYFCVSVQKKIGRPKKKKHTPKKTVLNIEKNLSSTINHNNSAVSIVSVNETKDTSIPNDAQHTPKKTVLNIEKNLSSTINHNNSAVSIVSVNETKDTSITNDAHDIPSKSAPTISEKQSNLNPNQLRTNNASQEIFPESVDKSQFIESQGLMETKVTSIPNDAHDIPSKSAPTISEKQSNLNPNHFGTNNACEEIFPESVNNSQFIESQGLMAQVIPRKSQKLLVCAVCGSVHYNGFDLKRHKRKHMLCQFCKSRFTSLEAKLDHVENSCEIKKILNTSNPSVILEKIDLNAEVRKKYMDVFSNFDPVPDLPLSNINVGTSESTESIIDLSKDEELEESGPLSSPSSSLPSTINSSFPRSSNDFCNKIHSQGPEGNKNSSVMNDLSKTVSKKELIQELIKRSHTNIELFRGSLQNTDNKENKTDTCEDSGKMTDVLHRLKPSYVPLNNVPSNGMYNPKFHSKLNRPKIVLKKRLSERNIDNRNILKLSRKSRSSSPSSLSEALLTDRAWLSLNLPVPPLSPLKPPGNDEVCSTLPKKKVNNLCTPLQSSLSIRGLKSVDSIDSRLKNILTHTKMLIGSSNSGIQKSQKNGQILLTFPVKAARSKSAHTIMIHGHPKTPLSNSVSTEPKRSLSKSNNSSKENIDYIDCTYENDSEFKVMPLVQKN